MSTTTNNLLEIKEDKQWHLDNCEITYENDYEAGTIAYCEEHQVDVTEVLPDYDYEPDPYDNSEENEN